VSQHFCSSCVVTEKNPCPPPHLAGGTGIEGPAELETLVDDGRVLLSIVNAMSRPPYQQ